MEWLAPQTMMDYMLFMGIGVWVLIVMGDLVKKAGGCMGWILGWIARLMALYLILASIDKMVQLKIGPWFLTGIVDEMASLPRRALLSLIQNDPHTVIRSWVAR